MTDPTTTVQGAASYDIFGLTATGISRRHCRSAAASTTCSTAEPERVGAGQIQTSPRSNGGGQTMPNGAASTNAGYYDVLGRRYFLNLKMRF